MAYGRRRRSGGRKSYGYGYAYAGRRRKPLSAKAYKRLKAAVGPKAARRAAAALAGKSVRRSRRKGGGRKSRKVTGNTVMRQAVSNMKSAILAFEGHMPL